MNPVPKPCKKVKKVKRKKPSLLKLADQAISWFVRERDNHTCITCGKYGDQNGHYISRAFHGTRFDERNCNCQCNKCNVELRGNLVIYKQKIVELHGFGILAELDLINKVNHKKTSVQELNRILNYYSTR